MKMWRNLLLVSALLSVPVVSHGDPGNNYCITPAFITANIKPNLLLMIDNSASMYDLAYIDKGLKHCSNDATKTCADDSECPGGTCSVVDRNPTFCYDETFHSGKEYYGYFDRTTYYSYRPLTDDFAPEAGGTLSCSTDASYVTRSIPGIMCLKFTTSPKALVSFVAKGDYLNWLSASKMDVEKKILTGGKFNGSFLLPESRGCVGQGYVKDALAGDFVNYTTSDPNVPLGVTFRVKGPWDTANPSAPSVGGQTYIDIFSTPGKVYDSEACDAAYAAIDSGTNAAIKTTVGACLQDASPAYGSCQQKSSLQCITSTDCELNTALPQTSSVCSGNPAQSCTTDSNCTVTGGYCSGDTTRLCTLGCGVVNIPERLGTCGTQGSYSPVLPSSLKNSIPSSCRTNAECSITNTFKGVTTTYTASCTGYAAASTKDYGTCQTSDIDWRPCTSNYVGPCVTSTQQAVVKTKVSFQQSMQACWQVRENHAIGTDEIKTINNQCSDVYGGFATCANNAQKTCTTATATADCGEGIACVTGPAAIAAGNPALICGTSYMGKFFQQSGSAWVLRSSLPATLPSACASGDTFETCQEKVYATYCSANSAPNVMDPTDSPSNTPATDNVPAILSGTSVEAQLGSPIITMKVKIATSTAPEGLVQQFSDQIRLGAMSFNKYGSSSETALTSIGTPAGTNLDGSTILYKIGSGSCATMTSVPCKVNGECTGSGETCLEGYCGVKGETACTTLSNCTGSNQACIADPAGLHTSSTSLVRKIDDVKAETWTPLAEGFYNAIGYYARTATGTSRTDVRLNTGDFDENYNPSEYRCQQNYVLLVSDGASTADLNSSTTTLANSYASSAGITQRSCTTAARNKVIDYGGNNNFPIMTWLAKNRNITNFSLTPSNARDSITTYIVFNGESNGAAEDCNSVTLMTEAATKGGTQIKMAKDFPTLSTQLTKVFQDVAAKAASGTAASILSNSEGSGANILQAVFYPKKIFNNSTSVNWIGEMQNLWYYVDPYINNSTIREDTPLSGQTDYKLNLLQDKVVRFTFDNSSNKAMVQLYQDSDGNGTGDTAVGALIDPDEVHSLWRAGELLYLRSPGTRQIYTPYISGGTLTSTGSGLMLLDYNSNATKDALIPYLQAGSRSEANDIMQWVYGFDITNMRSRTVQMKTYAASTWKLGDIISSTPRVQSTVRLGTYNLAPPGGYNDASYLSFVNSNQYQSRGTVYVGANDGMLHAFKLGLLSVKSTGYEKATLTADPMTDLGKEQWAFIPKNYLPYLKYLQDPDYQHLYGVDGKTVLVDASIGDLGTTACNSTNYWNCLKPTMGADSKVTDSSNDLASNNTWRTILISGMGLGGASAKTSTTNFVTTPINDPANDGNGFGYSSYFALDVTNPATPKLLWEFSNPYLGYSTTGPAVVRIGDSQKNGRWFAIFGSGPTGPIDTTTHQFQGRSGQQLRFFVVDLKTGELVKQIDTGIANAFSGSLTGGAIDADRWDPISLGNYQDDAVYVGYVKQTGTSTAWTDGGLGRIMINRDQGEEPTTANLQSDEVWKWSTILEGIGPVTTAISRLQDRKNRNLWLYGGTGRYFYRDSVGLDDNTSRRMLFGVKEPCYNKANIGNYLDKACTDGYTGTVLEGAAGALVDQTSDISSVGSGNAGWRIKLDASTSSVGAERLVTDTVSLVNGTVFFTSFSPTMDPCGYGGNSYLWGVKYDTGDAPPANALTGKALIQLSTGEFKEVDLSTVFTDKLNRRMATPLTGKPPSDAPPVISSSTNRPVKKILHIQEH
ncbi:pilus assembly protein PilY [Geomonas sp. RF6]|uniref:pilus assembly protein n=1 Tax=Geomonas sp. RF6 TaxID=2897342 RepID=UPI001E5A030E|nr:PilC/PilY family type IV pilus protein [Geomonas sp. RF6]UFS69638.1 pilus assembly protein PilY [Geomonas sp. RF6]